MTREEPIPQDLLRALRERLPVKFLKDENLIYVERPGLQLRMGPVDSSTDLTHMRESLTKCGFVVHRMHISAAWRFACTGEWHTPPEDPAECVAALLRSLRPQSMIEQAAQNAHAAEYNFDVTERVMGWLIDRDCLDEPPEGAESSKASAENIIRGIEKVSATRVDLRLVTAAQVVIDSADDTGCSDDLTVVSKEAVEALTEASRDHVCLPVVGVVWQEAQPRKNGVYWHIPQHQDGRGSPLLLSLQGPSSRMVARVVMGVSVQDVYNVSELRGGYWAEFEMPFGPNEKK